MSETATTAWGYLTVYVKFYNKSTQNSNVLVLVLIEHRKKNCRAAFPTIKVESFLGWFGYDFVLAVTNTQTY